MRNSSIALAIVALLATATPSLAWGKAKPNTNPLSKIGANISKGTKQMGAKMSKGTKHVAHRVVPKKHKQHKSARVMRHHRAARVHRSKTSKR